MTTRTTTSSGSTTDSTADHELKARHRAMWELGDYPAVARAVIPGLGAALVEAAGVTDGQRVLDVAAGAGNATIPAARRGAHVDAVDLAPALLAEGRRAADEAGLAHDAVTWVEGDAEHLPFPDASYDVVLSSVGVMFAPHHELAAAELLRVCRPGGTIALASWTPEGFVGRLFAALRPYAAPPPPGSTPPPRWGEEAHVRALLGDGVDDLVATKRVVETGFPGPTGFRELFAASYGPTVAAYARVGDDAGRRAALDADLDALAEEAGQQEAGRFTMGWEYLQVVARRR